MTELPFLALLPEDDEILLTAADGAAVGGELAQLGRRRKAFPDVRLWMERRAEVRARNPRPPGDRLPGVVPRTLVGVEPVRVRVAVRGQEQEAAGSDDPTQLFDPGALEIARQMREDGDRVDEPELRVLVAKRRFELVDRRRDEREVRRAPGHEPLVVVAAVNLGAFEPGPVP